MNSIQQKLLSLEATPPPGLWEKIAEDLDEAELEHQFPSTLYALSVPPPAGVWEKISQSLDATADQNIADKLLAYEVVPPAAAWNSIKIALDAEHEAAIPEHRRFSPLLRYAAAAAVVGILAWAGITLLNNNKETTNPEDKVARQEQPAAPAPQIATPTTEEVVTLNEEASTNNTTNVVANTEDARDDAALENSKRTYASLNASNNSKIKQAANFYFGEPVSTGTPRGLNFGDPAYMPVPVKDLNRYIVLMTPDGNFIRMSNKFGDLVCCVSGEEQDEDCKDQLKKWRDKMASPSATHSTGNVMDMLHLVNSLQNDNEL
jgi:hypothetical protein